MVTSTQWQLAREAAERYEQILVPAILGPAGRVLVDWSNIPLGATVLDVGCGTGAAARVAAKQVGSFGRVIGVDVNAGMIEVASSLPAPNGPEIKWYTSSAYQLPLKDESVEIALCAQTLQFLDDRRSALSEICRVLTKDGRLALSAWCDIRENPYFHALVEAVSWHVGAEVAAGLEAAFRLPDARVIRSLLTEVGFKKIEIATRQFDLPLPDLKQFVPRHISATPMAAGFNAASLQAQRAVIEETSRRLARYKNGRGVVIPFKTRLIAAKKTHKGVLKQ